VRFLAARQQRWQLPAAAVLLLATGLIALVLTCNGGSSSSGPRLKVITTLPLFADFVRNVGGDRVEVSSLIPPGVNPDTWQPAPGDAARVAAADIAFANGHDFEPAAVQVLRANLRPNAPLIEIAGDEEALEHEAGAEIFHETISGGHQPVLWMSVQNGKAYSRFIQFKLSEFDPNDHEEYEKNTEDYLERIDETERYAFNVLDSIPPGNKKLITPDTSLEYFGNYYAVEHTAQVSRFKGEEVTAQHFDRIKQNIIEREVLAVFVQPYDSPESDLLRRAADELGVRVCTLYSDSLDDKVATYIDLIRFDADELKRCLGGEGG
jgi:ABC-type Zn uptake system ZnuABC Zn-binding protein ZnuA